MSDELKPCPFCGGEATEGPVFVTGKPSGDIGWVGCVPCGVFVSYTHSESGRREAMRAWNARAERTCRWVPFDEGHSIAGPGWRCSECGLELGPENVFVVERCYCCPGCCSKVVG